MSKKPIDRGESTKSLRDAVQNGTEPDSHVARDVGGPDPLHRAEAIPKTIGLYKILDILGLGGMGVVYLAEQTEPIRRRVALKLIKLGMDTKQVIARFESERQALALMNHPNVAKVLDAGATEQGRPYFVMEYVKGVSITDHCDRHRLSTKERLELFSQVCHAVQHAHQKGIIHRDIKPSNILVSIDEGQPVPKVIDFGVAKATQQQLTEKTLFTEQGQLIGTPEYMSPEQAEMTAQDIDTRTDIYSLGVVLYELLAGALPFDPISLRQAGFAEIQRIIREEEPPKPSTRLSSLGDESGSIAEKRRLDVGSLTRQLRGDLDWITMKALEKDRTRRYASASELSEDIARHRKHEPVLASPPRAAYRLRKFVRRYRGTVAAGIVVAVVLVGGLAGTSYGLVQAVRAREAEAQQRRFAVANQQKAVDAAKRAFQKVVTARNVIDFLLGLFEASRPSEAMGNAITVREVLDKGIVEIRNRLSDDPESKCELMHTMYTVYIALGLYDPALQLAQEALHVAKQGLGNENEWVWLCLMDLASVLSKKGDYEEAERRYREALALRHKQKLPAINNVLGLASMLRLRGEYDEAEALLRSSLALRRKHAGDKDEAVAALLEELAFLFGTKGNFDDAERLSRESFAMTRELLGHDHPETLTSINDMGILLDSMGKYTEAEPYYREALEGRRRVLGNDHPDTLGSINDMGGLLKKMGKLAEAELFYRECLESQRRILPDGHPKIGSALINLGMNLVSQENYTDAEPILRECWELRRKTLPEEHWHIPNAMSNLGEALAGQCQFSEAEPLLLEAFDKLHAAADTIPPQYQEIRLREAIDRIVTLYQSWDAAEPGKGYAEKAAEWRAKLGESQQQ